FAPRLPGPDVELPAVPGAGQDLARARVLELARHPRLEQPPRPALAERAALVRAAVPQREELPFQIEDADRAPRHLDDLASPRRNLLRRRHHVPSHTHTWSP